MTTTELTTKITSLKELKRMVEEFSAEITSIEDEIKAEMTAQGVNELIAGVFKVRRTPVKSNRFDPLFPSYDYATGGDTAKAFMMLRCFGPISV